MSDRTRQKLARQLDETRILVVEDEFYIADDVRRALVAVGATVIGPVSTVAAALRAIDEENIGCAVLDLNLHGDSGEPVARRLSERRIPFAITTGYGSPAIPDQFRDRPRCEKPFDPEALVKVVGSLESHRS